MQTASSTPAPELPRKRRRSAIALRARDFFDNPQQRILIYRRKRQEPYVQHWHEFLEIAVICSGTGEHVTGGHRDTVRSGDVLVISHPQVHGYEETRHLSLINILIRDDLLPQVAGRLEEIPGFNALFGAEAASLSSSSSRRQRTASRTSGVFTGRVRLSREGLRQVEGWVACMEGELALQQPSSFLLAEAYLALIVGLLARCYGSDAQSRKEPQGHGPERLLFEPLLHWLEEHLDDAALGVADMARQAGMSQRSFYRAFRAAVGLSPKACLQQMRLRKAAELLQGSTDKGRGRPLTVTEVAQQVGFEDSNYFSRSFCRFFGVAPRRYRQEAPFNAPQSVRSGSPEK